jgi:hypothetical protein
VFPNALPLLALFITVTLPFQYLTPILTLTLNTNEQIYNVGEDVEIYGALFYKWEPNIPVVDLVTLQIKYPSPHGLCMLRTLPTGSIEQENWLVEILQVFPCDQNGNPKNSFKRGTLAYFKIQWKNNDDASHYAIITLTLCYGNSVPFYAYSPNAGTLAPNETRLAMFQVPIPSDATLGPARIYVSALLDWPSNSGHAYCPEKSADFTITSSSSFTTSTKSQIADFSLAESGTYNLAFQIPSTGAFIGNYTIYASSRLLGTQQAINTTTFEVILLGDVNEDFVVDGQDYQIIKNAIPSTPGSPEWNPKYDLNNDDVVDGQDFLLVKINIGDYASP